MHFCCVALMTMKERIITQSCRKQTELKLLEFKMQQKIQLWKTLENKTKKAIGTNMS